MDKVGKSFTYDEKTYVILKTHTCGSASKSFISIDSDLDNQLLFCEDFHPWYSNLSCEFRAILQERFDPQMGLEYYIDCIEDLLYISEIDSKIKNW